MFIYNNLDTILVLILVALTTCELLVQKDISKALRAIIQSFAPKSILLREFTSCPTCHTTMSYFLLGSLTALVTLNWWLFVAVLVTAVPVGLIAYLIYK